MEITSYEEAEQALSTARSETAGKPIANNTRLYRRDDDRIAVQLHGTDVVTYHKDGAITLDSGGWQTVTTKQRMNRFTQRIRVYQENYEWFIWIAATDTSHPYHDGWIITQNEGN